MSNRLAIVTGANGHLGNAIARRLHDAGHQLLLIVHRNRDAAETLGKELDPTGDTVRIAQCDLAVEAQIVDLFESALLTDEQLSVLVNNHATINRQPLADLERDEFERVLSVNLVSCWRAMQLAAQLMPAAGGAIVNIGSAAARLPMLDLGAYTMSKAGLHMLTRVAAQEWGVRNIRVNTVSPGLVPSAMSKAAFGDPENARRRRAVLAVNRFGEADDVAHAVTYLASEQAAYVTGQELVVDGGSHDNFLKPLPM